MPFFADRVEIAGPARITRDGYLVADARVGKANNIQTYSAGELGMEDRDPRDQIRVFRPEDEVFAADALKSLAHRPVTIDHPSEQVTAENWRKLAVGDVGGEIARDGEFIRVPLKVMDADAINAIRIDHSEFSLGYRATLSIETGDYLGEPYDAVMRNFRYNHLAAVPAARGGPELRIVDERPSDARRKPEKILSVHSDATGQTGHSNSGGDAKMPHVLIIDGLQVPNVSDEAKAAIEKLQGQVKDAQEASGKLTGDLATANTTIQTKDGEIAALKKQLEDAQVTPARLQQLADARAKVIEDAKKLDPKVVTDGKTDAEIKRAAVSVKLGDAAKDMADAAVEGAFAALVSASPTTAADSLRSAIASGQPATVGDAEADYETARAALKKNLSDAWKGEPAKAA
jgi:hypothetical protein